MKKTQAAKQAKIETVAAKKEAQGNHWGFYLYMLCMLLVCSLTLAVPLMAEAGYTQISDPLYYAFSFSCHQLTSRSLCTFGGGGPLLGDCGGPPYSRSTTVVRDGMVGYKLPICARDFGIYFAMLAGGFLLPLLRRASSLDWPSPWILVAFLIPMAIDGGTQLIGLRESTDFLRLLTGALAGFLVPFYLVPMLNRIAGIFLRKK